jgi:RNA polymerase sigma factor (sigma-70 family)
VDEIQRSSDSPVADSVAARRELVVFARRLLGTAGDAAEDVVQDAYVHLMSRASAGNPPEHARAWLYAVVRSRCRDELGRRREQASAMSDEIADSGGGPEEAVIVAAEGRWMLDQVDALPDREREAVVAHLAGRRAHARGRSANASHQALFRGRARLRQAYEIAWAGGVGPVLVTGRWLRRAFAAQFAPSAYKGTSGVIRAAVIGGTAVAAGVGGPPAIRIIQPAPRGHHEAVARARPAPTADRPMHPDQQVDVAVTAVRHPSQPASDPVVRHPTTVTVRHRVDHLRPSAVGNAVGGDEGSSSPDPDSGGSCSPRDDSSPEHRSRDGRPAATGQYDAEVQAPGWSPSDSSNTDSTSTDPTGADQRSTDNRSTGGRGGPGPGNEHPIARSPSS